MSVTRRRMQPRQTKIVRRRRRQRRRHAVELLGRNRDTVGVSLVPEFFYDFCLGGEETLAGQRHRDLSARPFIRPSTLPLSLSFSLALTFAPLIFVSPVNDVFAKHYFYAARPLFFSMPRGPGFLSRLACTRYESRRGSLTEGDVPKRVARLPRLAEHL